MKNDLNIHEYRPFFSVVIPVFNKGPHIARSISSVLNQIFRDFELLIVCDPSSDNSNEEVAKFYDPRIRTFHRNEPGPGGYAARNLGIKEAKAEWIAFLDADDEWSVEHLSSYRELISRYPDINVLGCGARIIDPELKQSESYDGFYNKYKETKNIRLDFEGYLAAEVAGLRPLNGSTACIKRKTLIEAKMFPAGRASRGGDVDTWLRCIEKARGLAWSSHVGATYYRDSVNMVTKRAVFLAEVERATVAEMLPTYKGRERVLLKQFANNRTISAWRQNNEQKLGRNFFILDKIYYSKVPKRTLLWAVVSLMPRDTIGTLRRAKMAIKSLLVYLKRSRFGTAIKFIRYKFYRFLQKSEGCGKKLDVTPLYLSDKGNATFFGYHDKTPFSHDGSKILAMSVVADDAKADSECTEMKIGYFEKNSKGDFGPDFIQFGETTTWCWQQGCMLQWHPKKNDVVVFNIIKDGKYGACIKDISEGAAVEFIDYPIYSLSSDGKWATTLNFSRLGRLRPGYGYPLLADRTCQDASPANDGLFLVRLDNGDRQLLVSLKEIAADKQVGHAQHYINHAVFSPDNNTVLFFHLWAEEGDKNRGLRTCAIRIDTKEWWVVEEQRIISHFCWRDAENLFATTKVAGQGWKYSLYNIHNKTRQDYSLPLTEDSHPMYHPLNKSLIVVDTYPDKARNQHLYLINLETSEVKQISSLHSEFRYQGQVRCDLHSRWNRDGNYVVVDTTSKGKRKLALFYFE